MERLGKVLLFAAAIAAFDYAGAIAATDSVQIEGVTLTNSDMHQLFAALHSALDQNDHTISLFITMKKPAEMPLYDQQYHYAGIEQSSSGGRGLHVWLNSQLKGKDLENALTGGIFLAVTDGGYGGPAFKKLYDVFAQEDSELPPNAPDPFLNRHRFAAALVKYYSSP